MTDEQRPAEQVPEVYQRERRPLPPDYPTFEVVAKPVPEEDVEWAMLWPQAQRAVEMRTKGMSVAAIARELHVAPQRVHYLLTLAYQKSRGQVQEETYEMTSTLLAQLTASMEKVLTLVDKGELGAVDRQLQITDRICKILGLFAPEKVDIESKIAVIAAAMGLDPEDARQAVKEVLRANQG